MRRRFSKHLHSVRCRGPAPLLTAALFRFHTQKCLPSWVWSYPRFAQIEIINVCNIRCVMCLHNTDWWRRTWPPRRISLDEFRSLLDRLPGISHVELNGLGEPLLHPDLPAMIEEAQRRGLTSAFFTNGTLLNASMAATLVTLPGLVEIRFSIDTADPNAFAKQRQGAQLHQILDNIQTLMDARKRTGRSNPAVTVSMTAMPEYVADLPRLIQTLQDIGLRELQVKDVTGVDDILPNDRLTEQHLATIDQYQEFYAKQGFAISHWRCTPRNTPATRTCIAPWHTIYINAGGDVHPCCFAPFPDQVFGNLLRESFWRIWNNKRYRVFRVTLKRGMPSPCVRCTAHGQVWKPAPRSNNHAS